MARETTKMREIVKRLRAMGFVVKFDSGWATRGSRVFDPHGFVVHHDVSPRHLNWGVYNIVKYGRSDVPGPLANWVLARDGQIAALAAGRANHAGRGRVGAFGALRGSTTSWGCEAANTGTGEPWGARQLQAYYALCRVAEDVTGYGRNRTIGHKEWAPTRKIDPFGINMNSFRRAMGNLMLGVVDEQEDDFMKVGDKGAHVRALQELLNDWLAMWNYERRASGRPESSWTPLAEDGDFGPKTEGRTQYALKDAGGDGVQMENDQLHAAQIGLIVESVSRMRAAGHNYGPHNMERE